MTSEQAKGALVLLGRVDLKGIEAQAFVEICQAINEIATAQPVEEVVPTKRPYVRRQVNETGPQLVTEAAE